MTLSKFCKSRFGFTLVELMIVILIVAILAAVVIPILRGRIDEAKWSEGKAIMGSIATACRAWCAEKGPDYDTDPVDGYPSGDLIELGFAAGDCNKTYFVDDDFTYTITSVGPPPKFTVTCMPTSDLTPPILTLDQDGVWRETPGAIIEFEWGTDVILGKVILPKAYSYDEYKIVAYVKTDIWYAHPWKGASGSINKDGSWELESVKRTPPPTQIRVFLVEKDYIPPALVENPLEDLNFTSASFTHTHLMMEEQN